MIQQQLANVTQASVVQHAISTHALITARATESAERVLVSATTVLWVTIALMTCARITAAAMETVRSRMDRANALAKMVGGVLTAVSNVVEEIFIAPVMEAASTMHVNAMSAIEKMIVQK